MDPRERRYFQTQLARDLRQRSTRSEQKLWSCLRDGRLNGKKFRRQRPLGRYIADFCNEAEKLVVEIDGSIHAEPEQMEYDAIRDEYLMALGYTVLRFKATQVMSQIEEVLHQIDNVSQSASLPLGERWPKAGVRDPKEQI
jgi:very-short-patch-repair endonuclease